MSLLLPSSATLQTTHTHRHLIPASPAATLPRLLRDDVTFFKQATQTVTGNNRQTTVPQTPGTKRWQPVQSGGSGLTNALSEVIYVQASSNLQVHSGSILSVPSRHRLRRLRLRRLLSCGPLPPVCVLCRHHLLWPPCPHLYVLLPRP